MDGLVVSYRDTEIRLNTARVVPTHQNVGEDGNSNMCYATFKAYAPEGAASVIEGQNDVMDTKASELLTDAYGRKYTVIWSAIASYSNGVWSKWGDLSSVDKYYGFLYSFNWLDAAGEVIQMDKVRVILTNDACHTDLVPDVVARSIDYKIKKALNGDTNLDNYYTKIEVDSKFLTEAQVDAHINQVITDAVDGDTLTNLTELVEYINTHDTDIILDIDRIEKQLAGIGTEEGAVKNAIDSAIVALNIEQYATKDMISDMATKTWVSEEIKDVVKYTDEVVLNGGAA